MANENNEIGDVVKKCKILLLDIEGTTTSINFVKDKLFPYAEENVKQFLDSQWENDDVKEAVAALRKLALEDAENKLEGVVSIPGEDASKEDQIEGLVNSVKWQMATDRKVGALKLLQGLIWKQGYENGDLKGHVYEDVSPALEQWRSVEDHKVYIYSSGSVQAQKLLFGQSVVGDLLPHIDGHFDTAVGAKQEVASYKAIVEKLACKPEEILFLTDILKEAEAARGAGLHVALVSREGNAPLSSEATSAYPLLHSLAQLTVSYKRKTDPQDEQPAKILKTEADKDVKSNSEVQVIDAEKELHITEENIAEAKPVEVEKMEVETTQEPAVENKAEQASIPVRAIAEEITDTSEIVDTTNSKNEHVVVEQIEQNSKTAEIIDSNTNNINSNNESQEKIDDKYKTTVINTTTEEINATVITEIEELTSDKQPLEEVGEIIEDLEPMVEEPVADEDMEELRNVGEVLEKECDEILSKVQDVTNLATITVKPLLNPIIEETMETDTADSNDIVDRILDTELEMEMNKNEQVFKTASEIVIIEELKETEVLPEAIDNQENANEKSQEDIIDDCNSKQKETCLNKVEVIGSGDVISEETVYINKENEVQGNKEILNETNSESVSIEITNEKPESAVVAKEVSNSKIVESAATEEVTNEKVDEGMFVDGSTVLQDPPIVIELTNGKLSEDITMEQITEMIEPSVVAPEEMAKVIVEQSNPSTEVTNNLKTKEEPMVKATDESCKTEEKIDKDQIDGAVKEAKNLSDDTKVASDNEKLEEKLSQVEESAVEKNENSLQEKNTTENLTESSNMEISVAESKENDEQEKSQSEVKVLLETNINDEKRHEVEKEVQVNGKATTNGDSDTVINGDPRKDEEINSRLSSENEKDVVNGSNGEAKVEQGQGDSNLEMDVTDIKVKTVSTGESHTDPVEQSTEA